MLRSRVFQRQIGIRFFHSSLRISNSTTTATGAKPDTSSSSSSTNSTSAPSNNGIITIRSPGTIKSMPIDPKYRLGYEPLYENDTAKQVATSKRVSIAVGVVGIYVTHLMGNTTLFSDEMSYVVTAFTLLPIPLVNYFTRHYVSRIFRLYDTTKPQTLENLTTDETLVAEKISWSGRSYYNRLMKVQDLKLCNERLGFVNWQTKDDKFYILDDLGGLKMDRIWGIVEHNSGVNNGRYFGK